MRKALILATIAMLIECLLIGYTIRPHDILTVLRPVLLQMSILIIAFFINPMSGKLNINAEDSNLKMDHPIRWKNVLKLSIIVLVLIAAIHILEALTSLPLFWSSLIVSIIEAHAVLAAGLSAVGKDATHASVELVVIAVIIGNTISKILIIIKAKNKSIIWKTITPFALSAIIPVVDYLIFK